MMGMVFYGLLARVSPVCKGEIDFAALSSKEAWVDKATSRPADMLGAFKNLQSPPLSTALLLFSSQPLVLSPTQGDLVTADRLMGAHGHTDSWKPGSFSSLNDTPDCVSDLKWQRWNHLESRLGFFALTRSKKLYMATWEGPPWSS